MFQNVLVARSAQYRANLAVTRTSTTATGESEIVAATSNRPAGRRRLREYAQRMHIDESFRDAKSGGFAMEHTRLQYPERVERLLLAVVLANLWCHEWDEQISTQGEAMSR